MKKVALMIDGGYLRVGVNRANKRYNPDAIEKIALNCIDREDEELYKVFYSDLC